MQLIYYYIELRTLLSHEECIWVRWNPTTLFKRIKGRSQTFLRDASLLGVARRVQTLTDAVIIRKEFKSNGASDFSPFLRRDFTDK